MAQGGDFTDGWDGMAKQHPRTSMYVLGLICCSFDDRSDHYWPAKCKHVQIFAGSGHSAGMAGSLFEVTCYGLVRWLLPVL
jgi:hypothetical protein